MHYECSRGSCEDYFDARDNVLYTHIARYAVVPACFAFLPRLLRVVVLDTRIGRSERYDFTSAAEQWPKLGGILNSAYTSVLLLVSLDVSFRLLVVFCTVSPRGLGIRA